MLGALALFACGGGGADGTTAGQSEFAATLAPVVVPAWVKPLPMGQWHEIPNTAMSSVAPSPAPPGDPKSKVDAWTSFVADARTSKIYSVANGGHSDYAGNEVDALELEHEQPAWRQLLAPTPAAQLVDCQSYYADGRPASRHTYYGVALNAFDDRIMLFGGAESCTNGGFHTAISSYGIGSNRYAGAGSHPDLPSPFETLSSYVLDPFTGDVYVVAFQSIGRWRRASNTFETLNPAGVGAWGYTMAAYDTMRRRILVLGSENKDRHLYTLSSNAWSTVTLVGANAAAVADLGQAAMVYVPPLDAFLVRGAAAGGTVYRVDASTFEVTKLATTGGAAIPETINGPYNKFLYLPRLGGIVYVPSYSGNAWFLRLHAGTAGISPARGVRGAVDSSLVDRHLETANLVYAFPGFGTAGGTPVAAVPVVQNPGGCSFRYDLAGLPDGNYTIALTGDGGASFPRTANLTVAGATAVWDFVPARVLRVGPTGTYAHPNDVQWIALSGDVIEIDAGEYLDAESTWVADNLTLRGVGGRAHLVAPAVIGNGKGVWVAQGTNIAIENIELSGAAVDDMNGAGIRAEGEDLVVCGGYVHDNQDGILTGNNSGNVLIEYSEFARNGHCDPQPCSHNMYIGGKDRFTLRHSYSHHAHSGHVVKSRARENYILYNRLMDEADGDSSYIVDLPNGGLSYVIGNLLQQGPNTENSTILTYGAESLSNPDRILYVANNTFVNDHGTGTFVFVRDGSTATVRNNLFVGPGTQVSGPATQDGNRQTSAPNFVDIAAYDYRPTASTPGIDEGVAPGSGGAFALTPIFQYVHATGREARPVHGAIDVGAYEYSP